MNGLEIGVFGNTQQTDFQGSKGASVLQRRYPSIGLANTGWRPDDTIRTSARGAA